MPQKRLRRTTKTCLGGESRLWQARFASVALLPCLKADIHWFANHSLESCPAFAGSSATDATLRVLAALRRIENGLTPDTKRHEKVNYIDLDLKKRAAK